MSEPQFVAWPKTARLNRTIVVTEKIDGTNAAVGFLDDGTVYAQSRTRLITPEQDNYGFAKWAYGNSEALFEALGPGLHFGEWYGAGIQRKYGLTGEDKRFALFNTARYASGEVHDLVQGLTVVPVLYEGPFDRDSIDDTIFGLADNGSVAVPEFMKPEGVCIFHTASRQVYKVTLENDAAPKSLAS